MSSPNFSWNYLKLTRPSKGIYLAKIVSIADDIQFYVSDLENVWSESLNNSQIFERFKSLNTHVEVPEHKMEKFVKEDLLKNSAIIETDGEECIARWSVKSSSVLMKWEFDCKKLDSPSIAEMLSSPMFALCMCLIRQRDELAALLMAKDKEIKDHENQGSKVSRKALATAPYDALLFKNKFQDSYKGNFLDTDANVQIVLDIEKETFSWLCEEKDNDGAGTSPAISPQKIAALDRFSKEAEIKRKLELKEKLEMERVTQAKSKRKKIRI